MLNFKNNNINETAETCFTFDEEKNRLLLGKAFDFEYLTKRELEILKRALLGYTSKVIARELTISYRTVETYISTIKLKLGCTSKSALIEFGIKTGLFNYFFY